MYPSRGVLKGIASVAILAASLSACQKIKDLLTFNISNTCDFTVSSSSPVNVPFVVNTPDVTTNSSREFANNKTSAKMVKEVKLKDLVLTVTSPSGQNFDFLKTIHIYISTSDADEIELASLDNIPTSVTTIQLVPTSSKLDTYIKAEKYRLRTEVVTKQFLTKDVSFRADSKFSVTANL